MVSRIPAASGIAESQQTRGDGLNDDATGKLPVNHDLRASNLAGIFTVWTGTRSFAPMPVMNAPQEFANWMTMDKPHRAWGRRFRYHSRSPDHTVALANAVANDLLSSSEAIRCHASEAKIGYGIDLRFQWKKSGKKKTIDLAIGSPTSRLFPGKGLSKVKQMDKVFISCEMKTTMTEHGKSQPRIYDELSSSHDIVHQGNSDAIACGLVVVNIADRFASPLRQTSDNGELYFSQHNQPTVTQNMINHLRGLPIRDSVDEFGFDAFAIIVIGCDNVNPCKLWTDAPAPQPGDRDRYDTFISRIARAYDERFSDI